MFGLRLRWWLDLGNAFLVRFACIAQARAVYEESRNVIDRDAVNQRLDQISRRPQQGQQRDYDESLLVRQGQPDQGPDRGCLVARIG